MAKETQNKKKPWPTKDAMEQVYDQHLWGTGTSRFYSGEGSHCPTIVTPYVAAVTTFLRSFKEPLVVCDLGCGDFNIGNQLFPFTKKYEAVDIVTDLIAHNKITFQDDKLRFHCLDIAVDDLPAGDCAILRQVLQHLSNAEILNILKKLTTFKYVILTEHVPEGEFTPNKDIISGQGTRLKKQSGIDLNVAPFYFKTSKETEITKTTLPNNQGLIATSIFKLL